MSSDRLQLDIDGMSCGSCVAHVPLEQQHAHPVHPQLNGRAQGPRLTPGRYP